MFKQVGTIGKLATLLLLTLVCLLVALVAGSVGIMIFSACNGMDYTQVAADTNYLRIYQILSSLIIFVIPALVCAKLFDDNLKQGLYLNQKLDYKALIISLVAMLVALPLTSCLTDWNLHLSLPDFMSGIEEWMRQKEEHAKVITEKMLITDSFGIYLYNIIVLAVVPACSEELFFRATLQKFITIKRPILAAMVAGMIFSAFHLQFYGFLPRFALGFMLGVMLVCTNNILVPMAAHFLNNFMAVTAYYVAGGDIEMAENQSIAIQIPLALASAAAVVSLFYLLWKKRNLDNIMQKI